MIKHLYKESFTINNSNQSIIVVMKVPEYKIKGKDTEFVVELPELVDEQTKEIIEKTLKQCVKPQNQEKVMQVFNQLLSQTKALMNELKKDGHYHENIEKDVRRFVGIHMKKGFEVGDKAIQPHEVDIVQRAMGREQMKYEGDVIDNLPEDYQEVAKDLFTSLELGRMAFEAGLVIGILISTEEADKFYQQESAEMSYIH